MNKLDEIADKYKKTRHGIIMTTILNPKLVIVCWYQNMKAFWLKTTLQIGLKKSLWSRKWKTRYYEDFVTDDNCNEIVETFYEKKLQKTNQT